MVTVNLSNDAYGVLLQAKMWYLKHGQNRPLNALLSEAVMKTYGDLVRQEPRQRVEEDGNSESGKPSPLRQGSGHVHPTHTQEAMK